MYDTGSCLLPWASFETGQFGLTPSCEPTSTPSPRLKHRPCPPPGPTIPDLLGPSPMWLSVCGLPRRSRSGRFKHAGFGPHMQPAVATDEAMRRHGYDICRVGACVPGREVSIWPFSRGDETRLEKRCWSQVAIALVLGQSIMAWTWGTSTLQTRALGLVGASNTRSITPDRLATPGALLFTLRLLLVGPPCMLLVGRPAI